MARIPIPPAPDPVLDAQQRFTNAWRQFLQRLGDAGGSVPDVQAEIDALQVALAEQIAALNLLSEEVAALQTEVAGLEDDGPPNIDESQLGLSQSQVMARVSMGF